jgi:hypothetical protein
MDERGANVYIDRAMIGRSFGPEIENNLTQIIPLSFFFSLWVTFLSLYFF